MVAAASVCAESGEKQSALQPPARRPEIMAPENSFDHAHRFTPRTARIRTPALAAFHTLPHEIEQRKFQRPVRGQQHITDSPLLTNPLRSLAMFAQLPDVSFAHGYPIDVKFATVFHVFKN